MRHIFHLKSFKTVEFIMKTQMMMYESLKQSREEEEEKEEEEYGESVEEVYYR